MGFPHEVRIGIKLFVAIVYIFVLIIEWRKCYRIVKYGLCYEATVIGFKGYFFPCPIVRLDANGKMVEDKLSCGTAQNPSLNTTIKVYYWEEYYDEIISEIDSDLNPKYFMMLIISVIVLTIWTLA